MHDAGVRRDDPEIFERGLTPLQKRVALLVALKLDFVIEVECVGGAVVIDLYRVVDDQFGRRQRIDPVRRATET